MKHLTEYDKLECTEHTLEILEDALRRAPTRDGDFDEDVRSVLDVAKEAVRLRMGRYLDNRSNLQ